MVSANVSRASLVIEEPCPLNGLSSCPSEGLLNVGRKGVGI